MGFFDIKAKCSICDNDIGLNRYQLSKDVWICQSCLKKAGGTGEFYNLKQMSIDEIKNLIKLNDNKLISFVPTKKIGNYFYLDENNKQWAVPSISITGKIKNLKIYNYSDIVDFELIEDGNSITKGGLGRAIVGGALFGGTGAIVGGATGGKKSKATCSKLQIKITINNLEVATVYIDFITTEFKKDSFVYKEAYNSAQKVLSILQLICKTSNNSNNTEHISNADEIKKYKELLDIGAITQEEFEKKKRELL